MKKEIIIAIIISLLIGLLIGYYIPLNNYSTVETYIYGKFDGRTQDFEIRKSGHPDNDISPSDCDEEFLKRNPSFNDYESGDTFYCELTQVLYYDRTVDNKEELNGKGICSCYYK